MKKFFLFAAVAILALVGCEKQNQSSLDFEQVQQQAIVSGKLVTYVTAPGAETQTVALKGIRVYIEVPTSKYLTGAEGNQQFEAITAEDGGFTINVKTGAKAITGAKLHTDDFKFEVNGKTIYFEDPNKALPTLNAGDSRVELVVAEQDPVLSDCIGEGILKGKLTYNAGTKEMGDGTSEDALVAGANQTVTAIVTYFAGKPEKVDKHFITKTDANGEFSFSIPAEADGNDAKLEVAQFTGSYREFKNNQWVEYTAYYEYAATDAGTITAGAKTTSNIIIATPVLDEKTSKGQVKMNISGKVTMEVESIKTDKDGHATGVEPATTAYKSSKVVIELKNATLGKSIFYDVTTDDKGNYELKDAAIYDDWDIADVIVKAFVRGEIVTKYDKDTKQGGFSHYYLGYVEKYDEASGNTCFEAKVTGWYGKFGSQTEAADAYSSERLNGTYNKQEDDGLGNKVWRSVAVEGSMFFDRAMPELTLQFNPEDATIVKGVDGGVKLGTVILWADRATGKTTDDVSLYSNGIKVW